jgi:hypothetical protein
MTTQLQAHMQRIDDLRKWVRERQQTDKPVTFREVSRRYRTKLDDVESLAIDANLNINVGGVANGGTWMHSNQGDYTLEDLAVQP